MDKQSELISQALSKVYKYTKSLKVSPRLTVAKRRDPTNPKFIDSVIPWLEPVLRVSACAHLVGCLVSRSSLSHKSKSKK
jgi:hypothetical protein